jgi:hypothetical protein
MKLADLKALTLADGQQVPTLAEVFEEMGPDFLYNVELKDFRVRDSGLATAVAECVRQFGYHKQVLATSFSPLTVRRARQKLAAETGVGLIRYQQQMKAGHWLFEGVADHPHYSLVDDAYMAWANENKLRVHVWTVDDPAEARRLVDLGVHGLITNKPGFLREQLGYKMSIQVILNPYANRWQAQKQIEMVTAALNQLQRPFHLTPTSGPQHGIELAETAVRAAARCWWLPVATAPSTRLSTACCGPRLTGQPPSLLALFPSVQPMILARWPVCLTPLATAWLCWHQATRARSMWDWLKQGKGRGPAALFCQ